MEFLSTLSVISIVFGIIMFCICMYGYIVYVKTLSSAVFRDKARWPFQAALHLVIYTLIFMHGIHFLFIFWFVECCFGIEIDKLRTVKDWND